MTLYKQYTAYIICYYYTVIEFEEGSNLLYEKQLFVLFIAQAHAEPTLQFAKSVNAPIITQDQEEYFIQLTITSSENKAMTSYKLHLKVDNTNCLSRCFKTADSVARFIAMSAVQRKNGANVAWEPGFILSNVAGIELIVYLHFHKFLEN